MTARRVAVIGCGDISVIHLEAIAAIDGLELSAVCDPVEARRDAAARAWGVPAFADLPTLLDEARPDAVHVCTPHHTHADLAIAALERDVDVLLEKPVAHTPSAARRLAEAAARSAADIAVCFQNRYNEPVVRAHEILASGELGRVTGATATVMWHRDAAYYADRPWRGRWATGGGGLLMNQAIHTLDLLQWLVGPVARTSGTASTHALGDAIEVEDTAEMVLDHENGARSVFYATNAAAANFPVTLDIACESGSLSLREELLVRRADGTVETVSETAVSASGRSYWGVSHERLIRDFHLGDRRTPFWIGPEEAARSVGIISDVYRASFPGRVAELEDADANAHHDREVTTT